MWAVIKFDAKNFNFFKRELRAKLSCNHVLYCPKLLIQKYKNNKLIKKEYNILGDYVFCYDKKFQNEEILTKLKFVKGLKCILGGFSLYQEEIVKFISQCKKFENHNGYITQNFSTIPTDLAGTFKRGVINLGTLSFGFKSPIKGSPGIKPIIYTKKSVFR